MLNFKRRITIGVLSITLLFLGFLSITEGDVLERTANIDRIISGLQERQSSQDKEEQEVIPLQETESAKR